jgi:energy-coupling factor transporter ATP-binding protein EcfA2
VRIRTFRVTNYKSFADSGEMRLEPGFNVIVGRNNVGKTAMAEAVGLHFLVDKPHRSLRTVPRPGAPLDPSSQAELSIWLEGDELRELLSSELPTFFVPTDPDQPDVGEEWLQIALSEGVTVEAVFRNRGVVSTWIATYPGPTPPSTYLQFTVDTSGAPRRTPTLHDRPRGEPLLDTALTEKFFQRLYSFSAVRFEIDDNPIGTNRILAPNASDLVQVLDLLSRNTSRWQRYFKEVRTVLPEIKAVTFVPSEQSGGHVRALVWNVDLGTEREDLAVPLSESGTGVGQVLAILYVVFTSGYPRTIVIDEPQSFLHPGAVRNLFEILKGYPQHQYVITTHSPNAVTAADPRALFLVRKEGEESVVDQLDVSETRDQSRFLREVGASLSDVFGADNVLWVEGATEEVCFPLILSKLTERRLLGTKIVGVLNPGDLEGRRSRDVYRIYQRLTDAGGLLPPAVGFIFDREGRDKTQREDLERESDGLVTFTSRRMYENYLLNPRAIAHVVSGIKGFRDDEVSPKVIEGWIEERGWDDKYFDTPLEESARTHPFWLAEVDGAKVLTDLFVDLSETRVVYHKSTHGEALTRWLCDNDPEVLKELVSLIENRLNCIVPS